MPKSAQDKLDRLEKVILRATKIHGWDSFCSLLEEGVNIFLCHCFFFTSRMQLFLVHGVLGERVIY